MVAPLSELVLSSDASLQNTVAELLLTCALQGQPANLMTTCRSCLMTGLKATHQKVAQGAGRAQLMRQQVGSQLGAPSTLAFDIGGVRNCPCVFGGGCDMPSCTFCFSGMWLLLITALSRALTSAYYDIVCLADTLQM
jgi:hypothetical protein